MKKTVLGAAIVAMVSVAGAGLIPNGDFELGGATWVEAGPITAFAYPASGGSDLGTLGGATGGGYASMDASNGEWGVLVSPDVAGTGGGGWDIATVGATAGAVNTFTIDLINIAGTDAGGMKVEAWAGNVSIGDSGDRRDIGGANAVWTQFTFDWEVPVGTEKLIFVPLWGANSTVGYDNVGVVPEPATLGLLGIAGGAMIFLRRHFKV